MGEEKSRAEVDNLRLDLLEEMDEVGTSLWIAKVSDWERPRGTPNFEGGAESTREVTRVSWLCAGLSSLERER